MNKKEKWITEIQESINGIESPEVNPYLYNKILHRLNTKQTEYISGKLVLTTVVSFVILVTLNLFIFKSFGTNSSKSGNDLVKVSLVFHLVNENEINYN